MIFLKCIDMSNAIKDVKRMFTLLDSTVLEIREDNVVQVVIKSVSNFRAMKKMLKEERPTLFFSLVQ